MIPLIRPKYPLRPSGGKKNKNKNKTESSQPYFVWKQTETKQKVWQNKEQANCTPFENPPPRTNVWRTTQGITLVYQPQNFDAGQRGKDRAIKKSKARTAQGAGGRRSIAVPPPEIRFDYRVGGSSCKKGDDNRWDEKQNAKCKMQNAKCKVQY